LELITTVYVRFPPESVGSRLIIGRLLLISIRVFAGSSTGGVGLTLGEGLGETLGLGLGDGEGDGLPAGFGTLRVFVSWKMRRCA
jgi:hypothetical protein